MKTPKDPKFFYGLAGLAVLVGAGILFMQNSSLDPLRDQAAQLSEKSKEASQIYKKLDASKAQLTALQTELAHVEKGIPDAAYVPTMLKELELSGKEMGIEVAGLRPVIRPPNPMNDKVTAKTPYEPLDIELKGKGTYDNLVTFVKSLNTFPKIVEVRTIGIAPPAAGQRRVEDRLDFTLGLRAFLFKQAEAPKPVQEDSGNPDSKGSA